MRKQKTQNQVGIPQLARRINLKAVTRQMRRMEVFSKIGLAEKSGISNTTMSKLFNQLENNQLIERSLMEDKSFGRPKILYQLSSTLQVAAVFVDVDETTICISDLLGKIKAENTARFPTPDNAETFFTVVSEEYFKLCGRINASCRIIGICIPGLIESETGNSVFCPNLHWLENHAPADEIEKQTNTPTLIMQEEQALCRAQFPAADESTNYIAIDFSSGVGMSAVSNGEHLAGNSGFAGEIGHIIVDPNGKTCGCGNRGCLETIASDRVFLSETGLPIDDALERLREQHPPVLEAARKVLHAQAIGIATAINILNPQKVFVYSRLNEACPDYLQKLREAVKERTISFSFENCSIEATSEGKLKGALLLTIDRLLETATA